MGGEALEPDALVAGRYRLRRRLGEGGMGWVWEALDERTEQRVALKVLKGEREEDRRRFVREARAATAVRHPGVVEIRDVVDSADGTPVLVMELLEGETLRARLDRERALGVAAAAAVLLPVIDALAAAHDAGIVHRDLKPENIFLVSDGHVKVLDFGVAKLTAIDGLAARTEALTQSGSLIGTPYYMSPEQVVSERDLDARSDIWALGVVLYECLAGVRPTEGENTGRVLRSILLAEIAPISDRCPDLPPAVAALIGKMLVGDRNRRLRSLAEVHAVLASHEIRASARSDLPSVAPRGPARRGGRAALIAVALGACIVAAIVRLSAAPLEAARAEATSASVALARTAPEDAAPPPVVVPIVSVAPPAASTVPPPPLPVHAATCGSGQVLSNGHCCERGSLWRRGRCEPDIVVNAPF